MYPKKTKVINRDFDIANIIIEQMQGTISPEQETTLKEWLQESDKHQNLYHYLLQTSSFQEKQEIYHRFDSYYNYQDIQKRIHRKRIPLNRLIAAIIILLLSFSGILYYIFHTSQPIPDLQVADVILPGKATAVLILADGKKKKLDANTFQLTISNQQISNQQNKLKYTNQITSSIDTSETYHEIKVPRGGEYQVVLADGTHVWLNSESSIRYPIPFQGKQRKVYVQGELYFQVASDSLHPFIVQHDDLAIRVLGTEFNVRAYENEQNIVTTLVKGKVEIKTPQGKSHCLHPSQQLVYSHKNEVCSLQKVDPELYILWKDGIYMFKTQRLEEIMNIISRWYNVTVSYLDPTVKDIVFSGRLKRYEQAQSLLKIFEELGEVKFTIVGTHIIIDKK